MFKINVHQKNNKKNRLLSSLVAISLFFILLVGCEIQGPTLNQINFQNINLSIAYQLQPQFSGYSQEITLLEDGLIIEKLTKSLYQRKIDNELAYKLILKTETLNKIIDDQKLRVTEVIEYFTPSQRYYLEKDTWKTESKTFQPDGIIKIKFKEDQFLSSYGFVKDDQLVTFKGTVRPEKIKDFLNNFNDIKNVKVEVVYNEETHRLVNFKLSYQTITNRDVLIDTTISYVENEFTLPIA